ncbi:30630_t:CDS:2, partial [Gigaspora margarita]
MSKLSLNLPKFNTQYNADEIIEILAQPIPEDTKKNNKTEKNSKSDNKIS